MSAATKYYALQMKHQWNTDDLIFSQYEIGNGLDTNKTEVEIDNQFGVEKYCPSELDILLSNLG